MKLLLSSITLNKKYLVRLVSLFGKDDIHVKIDPPKQNEMNIYGELRKQEKRFHI